MARALCLDVGDRRIGVAVSDETKLIARPLAVIDRKREDAMASLAGHVAQLRPDEIVVGLPLHPDGRPSEQTRRVEAFVALLQARIGLPVRYQDERYSTGEAGEVIRMQGRAARQAHSRGRTHDDALAAAVILQRYLDENTETSD